jgi:ATP-binding cassette subfamily B multidrug efflux pump
MNNYLWQMRPYFRRVSGLLTIGSIAGILMNTAVVLPAILLGRAIDTANRFASGHASAAAVGWAALAFVAGTLATEAPRIVKRYWLAVVRARIRSDIRADALRGVLAWPMERLHRTPVGDLMARIVGDVEVLNTGVGEFVIETWDTVLFSLSLVVAMLFYDAGLTVLVLVPVPFALLLALIAGRLVSRRTTFAREVNADLTASLHEQLAGIRVLRLFGRSGPAVERFATISDGQKQANLATTRLQMGLKPVYGTLMTAGVVLLVWKGGERVVAGGMTIGALVAYLQLYARFITRAPRIPQMVNSIQSGGAAYARLRPLLAPPLPLADEPRWSSFRFGHVAGSTAPPAPPAAEAGSPIAVALEDLTFRYPGTASPALSHVSLELPAGAMIAVTGSVGSGKSALARALLGIYPLDGGRVLFDGRSLESIPPDERAGRVGYLPQDPHLFSGSIRENVLLGAAVPEAGAGPSPANGHTAGHHNGRDRNGQGDADAALKQTLALAALEADLNTFPAALETEIGELGVRVSGGQRQRIALARAVAVALPRAPGLLVLDDPFSAVDVDTEAAIVAALREAFGPLAPPQRRATILLCSHRLAAFPQADMVVVLDGGRIEAHGTHARLLAQDGLYARIYRAQRRADRDAVREGLGV